MRRRRYPSRILAFLLLLAFCQRLGASLWVHHFYHESRSHQAGTQWETRCDCFDDAFMPIEGAQAFVLLQPDRFQQPLLDFALPVAATRTVFHSSLRGPPTMA